MTTPSRRRLMRDFKKLQDDPPSGVSGAPTEENIMVWEAIIFGPVDTPFEDGTFKLSLEFTEEYPNKPPAVKFISKMFHPNVYADGSICLDILQNRWSPTYDVAAVLTSIQSLLDEPNPNSPANSVAAQLYQENRREYEKRVQAIVEMSWLAFNDEDVAEEDKSKSQPSPDSRASTVVPPTQSIIQNNQPFVPSHPRRQRSDSDDDEIETLVEAREPPRQRSEDSSSQEDAERDEENVGEDELEETSLPPPPFPPHVEDRGANV